MFDQQSLRSACAYAQSDQSLCSSLEYSMSVKLLTEDLLGDLSLKGGCTCSSESTLVKMPHCLKSHATAHMYVLIAYKQAPKAQASTEVDKGTIPTTSHLATLDCCAHTLEVCRCAFALSTTVHKDQCLHFEL